MNTTEETAKLSFFERAQIKTAQLILRAIVIGFIIMAIYFGFGLR